MVFVVTFDDQLKFGQAGEGKISQWLMDKGFSILPVYEKIINNGKGPQLFSNKKSLIAPDLFVFKGEDAFWIEAKHKTAFSWHRISQRWVTGIDLRHYVDYLKVDDDTHWPVFLFFLHDGGQAKDSPIKSPPGLFGNKLSFLRENESHRHRNHGNSGMVYWSIDKLKHYGTKI